MTRDELICEMSHAIRLADAWRLRLVSLDHCCRAKERCSNCPAADTDYSDAPKLCPTGEPKAMEEGFDYNPPPKSEREI